MANIIKTIYGRLLDWSGLANVPAVLNSLAGLKGSTGQIIEISGTGGGGTVSALTAVDKPAGAGSGENPSQGGLTTAQVKALDGMFRIAKYESDPTDAYAAFCEAFSITAKTLESIAATYTGGEVAVGTALDDLTGITVTATYSDGSTGTVTGYTLSGEIAEGDNTITVTYGGQTTAITVVGVASGADTPVEPLYGRFWPPKGKITDWGNITWDDVENFVYTGNSGQYIDAGLPGGTCVRLDRLQGTVYIRTLTKELYGQLTAFKTYSVYANSDGEFSTGGFAEVMPTYYRNFDGAELYIEVDAQKYYFVLFKFEIPVGQTGYFISQANAMTNGYFISSDKTGIDDEYKPYYTLFDSDPSDRITEPATEVV